MANWFSSLYAPNNANTANNTISGLRDSFLNYSALKNDAPTLHSLFNFNSQPNQQTNYVLNSQSNTVEPINNLVDLNTYAQDILKGKYGNGANRTANLAKAGLNPEQINTVQGLVNQSLKTNVPIKSNKTTAPVASGNKVYIPNGKEDFISTMLPYAQVAAERLGVDPYIIVAQAAHETGWGKHAPNNNYFGIKGKGGTFTTTEYVNGKPVTITDSFKGYRDMKDSVNGYADFILNNKRYGNAIGLNDARAYIDAIAEAGYATDPNYANRVYGIYSGIKPRN